MPFIVEPINDALYKTIKGMPLFIRYRIKIPIEVAFNANKSFSDGNILNGNYSLINVHQVYDAMDIVEDIDSIIAKLKNVGAQMIYANGDVFATLEPEIIEKFNSGLGHNFARIEGLHEEFASRMHNSNFFTVFDMMFEHAISNIPKTT